MSPGYLAGAYAGKRGPPVNWGSTQLLAAVICRFQCSSTKAMRDHLEYLKRSLFIANIMASGDTCPQGTSNARHVATLAGLKASRTNYTTSNENHKTASGQVSAAFT